MEIEDLKRIQRERGLGDVHVVYVGEERAHIAHTDAERAEQEGGGATLDQCAFHLAVGEAFGPPAKPGLVYTVEKHEPDGYSESYRGDSIGWDFTPLDPQP